MKEDILKLALEALDYKKSAIEKEIAEIRAELNGAVPNTKQSRSERMKAYGTEKRAVSIAKPEPKRRQNTSAEKELISKKLKAAWAKRKAAAAKR
jgi:hypothetical protein